METLMTEDGVLLQSLDSEYRIFKCFGIDSKKEILKTNVRFIGTIENYVANRFNQWTGDGGDSLLYFFSKKKAIEHIERTLSDNKQVVESKSSGITEYIIYQVLEGFDLSTNEINEIIAKIREKTK